MEEIIPCPNCKNISTYQFSNYMQHSFEIHKCKDCECFFEVLYEKVIKSIRIMEEDELT